MTFFPLVARYAFPIKCTDVIYGDSPDDIVEIRAEYDPLKTSKLKVTVHWNLSETVSLILLFGHFASKSSWDT
jgi:glutaminyl-tRNA synthetase